MNKHNFFVGLFAMALCFLVSCTKNEVVEPASQAVGSFTLEMEYVWGEMGQTQPFALNQTLVHPSTQDSLTFNTFKHYLSAVVLQNTDGSEYIVPNSFYLLDLSNPSSLKITLEDVPAGDYQSIHLVFGVDSLHNVSGAQEGALDPANGMFWSWNSGYIMLKAEGQSPNAEDGSFAFHLGGFKGENKVVEEKHLSFRNGELLSITPIANPTVHLMLNPAQLFANQGSLSNGSRVHMPGAKAKQMASPFNDWAHVDHIHP